MIRTRKCLGSFQILVIPWEAVTRVQRPTADLYVVTAQWCQPWAWDQSSVQAGRAGLLLLLSRRGRAQGASARGGAGAEPKNTCLVLLAFLFCAGMVSKSPVQAEVRTHPLTGSVAFRAISRQTPSGAS